MTDLKEILNKCRDKDRQAQSVLYNAIAPKILGVCVRYIRERTVAEDVMQDSLVKIFMSLDKYRFEGSFDGWCRQIAVNTALTHLKKEKKLKFDYRDDLPDTHENADTDADGHVPEEQDILDCLQQMPPGYSAIVNLFLFENYSHREIAEKLGISESTSRSQYTRARRHLSALLNTKMKNTLTKLTRQ